MVKDAKMGQERQKGHNGCENCGGWMEGQEWMEGRITWGKTWDKILEKNVNVGKLEELHHEEPAVLE